MTGLSKKERKRLKNKVRRDIETWVYHVTSPLCVPESTSPERLITEAAKLRARIECHRQADGSFWFTVPNAPDGFGLTLLHGQMDSVVIEKASALQVVEEHSFEKLVLDAPLVTVSCRVTSHPALEFFDGLVRRCIARVTRGTIVDEAHHLVGDDWSEWGLDYVEEDALTMWKKYYLPMRPDVDLLRDLPGIRYKRGWRFWK